MGIGDLLKLFVKIYPIGNDPKLLIGNLILCVVQRSEVSSPTDICLIYTAISFLRATFVGSPFHRFLVDANHFLSVFWRNTRHFVFRLFYLKLDFIGVWEFPNIFQGLFSSLKADSFVLLGILSEDFTLILPHPSMLMSNIGFFALLKPATPWAGSWQASIRSRRQNSGYCCFFWARSGFSRFKGCSWAFAWIGKPFDARC